MRICAATDDGEVRCTVQKKATSVRSCPDAERETAQQQRAQYYNGGEETLREAVTCRFWRETATTAKPSLVRVITAEEEEEAEWSPVRMGILVLGALARSQVAMLTLLLLAGTVSGNHHNTSQSRDCSLLHPACIRCNERGCIKCSELIQLDTRDCVSDCPGGYVAKWSTTSEFMGRVCYPVGFSGSFLAAVVGIAAGAVLCIVLIIAAMAVIRRKQKRKKYRETFIDENIDRLEFLKQLDELRPQAEYFLQMLNDTRRQIRKLHLAGDSSGAATYHPVVRDLAKILILLNKPIELISSPPHDWQRLYVWAEKVLDRYKPELTQLIEFLQQPSIPSSASDPRLGTSEHSTFKSKFSGSATAINESDASPSLSAKNQRNLLHPESASKQPNHFLGSLISLHEFDERSSCSQADGGNSSNPFGDTFDHVRSYLSTSGINDSSLWLQDEFFKLGFRPQDEITTEL